MTIELNESTRAAMQTARDLLADAKRIDSALDTQLAAVKRAQDKHEAAGKALAELDADLALQVNATDAKAVERQVKAAQTAEAEARADVERQQRIAQALRERLRQAEEHIDAERAVMAMVLSAHQTDVAQLVAAEIEQAAQPLIAALRRAAILQQASYSPAIAQALAATVLQNPAVYGAPFIEANRVVRDGRAVGLLDGWRDDPELLAAHDVAAEPRLVLGELKAYKPRAEREKQAEPYVRKGYTHDGVTPRPAKTAEAPQPAAPREQAQEGEVGHQLLAAVMSGPEWGQAPANLGVQEQRHH